MQYRLGLYFLTFEGDTRIELMNKPDLKDYEKHPSRTGYSHIAFSVGSVEKVNELTSRLKNAGFQVMSGPRNTGAGYYESCIIGVEGNLIEITI